MKYVIPNILFFRCRECNRTIFVLNKVFFSVTDIFMSKLWPKCRFFFRSVEIMWSKYFTSVIFLNAEYAIVAFCFFNLSLSFLLFHSFNRVKLASTVSSECKSNIY